MRKRPGVHYIALIILFLVFGVAGTSSADPLHSSPASKNTSAIAVAAKDHASEAAADQIPDLDLTHIHAELPVQQMPTASGVPPLAPEPVRNTAASPETIVVSPETRTEWSATSSHGPESMRPSRVPATPEPSTLPLLVTGLSAFVARLASRRRQRRQQKERATFTSIPLFGKTPMIAAHRLATLAPASYRASLRRIRRDWSRRRARMKHVAPETRFESEPRRESDFRTGRATAIQG